MARHYLRAVPIRRPRVWPAGFCATSVRTTQLLGVALSPVADAWFIDTRATSMGVDACSRPPTQAGRSFSRPRPPSVQADARPTLSVFVYRFLRRHKCADLRSACCPQARSHLCWPGSCVPYYDGCRPLYGAEHLMLARRSKAKARCFEIKLLSRRLRTHRRSSVSASSSRPCARLGRR